MRFVRTPSTLDRLADALRRADATWSGSEVSDEWERLPEVVQERWRGVARDAATTVFEEINADRHLRDRRNG